MNKTFNSLFYVKKAKINSVGESPIYLRITIDGKISEISTKRTVKPSKWNSAMQKVSGTSEECRSLNFYLKTFEQKVYDTYHELIRDKEKVTCEALKNKLVGRGRLTRTLIPADVYFGRANEVLKIRQQIKSETIKRRKKEYYKRKLIET